MKPLAAAALTAALLAGTAVGAFAQTTTTTTPAPAAAAPAKPMTPAKPMATAAAKPAMHHTMRRVAEYRDEHAGDPDTKALNLLEANGYTDIKSFRPVGGQFEASVDQKGRLITVTVDPGTGKITTHA